MYFLKKTATMSSGLCMDKHRAHLLASLAESCFPFCGRTVQIQPAPTISTKHKAGKQPGFACANRTMPLFADFLYNIPKFSVNDRFMGIFKYDLFFFWIVDYSFAFE